MDPTSASSKSASHARLGERIVPVSELELRAARLAGALAAGGVSEDDCVAILLRNDFSFLESMVATAQLGAYAVPINWHQSGEETGFILRDSAVKVLVVHADLLPAISDHVPAGTRVLVARTPPEIAAAYGVPHPLCSPPGRWENYEHVVATATPLRAPGPRGVRGSIVYTSGTTGRPKGVRRQPLQGDDATRFVELTRAWWGLRPGVRTVMAGPMYHSAPNIYARAVVGGGGSITIMPRFDAETLLQVIERDRVSHVHLVPTMFIRLLRLDPAVRRRYDVSSLEFVAHGAAPCPPEVKRAMIEWFGPVLHEYYGATETGMITRSSSQEWLVRPGTVGRAWPGREVQIYDSEGRRLGPNQVGEIYASLSVVPQFAYQNAPEQRALIERDGLVTCGDLGYLDEDGYLFVVDRKKDMIISGGVNIYPAEIEAALAAHPQVVDSAVIGIPDSEFGERVMAVIQPRLGETLAEGELASFLRQRIAGFKVPRAFIFTDALPRDDSGKLLKRKLRDPYWQERGKSI